MSADRISASRGFTAKVVGIFESSNYSDDYFSTKKHFLLEVLNNQRVFKMENFWCG